MFCLVLPTCLITQSGITSSSFTLLLLNSGQLLDAALAPDHRQPRDARPIAAIATTLASSTPAPHSRATSLAQGEGLLRRAKSIFIDDRIWHNVHS